jgi:hypothetical protein
MTSIEELNLPGWVLCKLQGVRYDYPDCFPEYSRFSSIDTIEQLIREGLKGIAKRPKVGGKALNEIAYRVKKYAENYRIKFNEEEFLKLKDVPEKIPEGFSVFTPKTKTGYVYAIEAEKTYIKIGISKDFPTKRMSGMSTGCPFVTSLAGYIHTDDARELEKKIHGYFKEFRVKGEWFKLNYSQIKEGSDFIWTDHLCQLSRHVTTIP